MTATYRLHLGDESCTVRAASPEAAKRKAAQVFADRRHGIIERRRNRQSGTTVLLIDSALVPGEYDEAGGRWQTFCEDHGSICSHESRRVAVDFLAEPADWCPGCTEIVDG